MRSFLGVVISSWQYEEYAKYLHNKNIIRIPNHLKIPNTKKLYKHEDLAFSLYDGINIVVKNDTTPSFLTPFVASGWLYDITDMKFVNFHDFERFISSEMRSRQRRIESCNQLRETIFRDAKVTFRACGPEWETIMNVDIAKLASEHVGLFDEGDYVTTEGIIHENKDFWYQHTGSTSYYNKLISDESLDQGQMKLYSLFIGFAQNRDIVYVGSSPGTGWMKAVIDMNYRGKVLAIDPRAHSRVYLPEATNVTTLEKMICTVDDFREAVREFLYFDLIWDVRGDYVDDAQYDRMVRDEIQLLNDILESYSVGDQGMCRINVKFSPRWGECYTLPEGGAFYRMPFCAERDVNELRYVARISALSGLAASVCDTLRSWKRRNVYEGCNYQDFCSVMLMRLDRYDYMVLDRFGGTKMDVNLFTLNRNPPGKVQAYLANFQGIASFFTCESLSPGEHKLREEEILSFWRHSVCDSRAFINRIITGLYLVIEKQINLFADEFRFSENYLIKGSFNNIVDRHGHYLYDKAKRAGALRVRNATFARFPMVFTVRDRVMSPSGHLMRMYYCYRQGNGSLFMFLDKMVANHYMSTNARSRSRIIEFRWSPDLEKFSELVPKYGHIECDFSKLWHSKDELLAGLYAIKSLFADVKLDGVINDLNRGLGGEKEGMEVYAFNRKLGLPARITKAPKLNDLFQDIQDDATITEFVESVAGKFDTLNAAYPNLLRDLVSFRKEATPFAITMISKFGMDSTARAIVFEVCAALCIDESLSIDDLGEIGHFALLASRTEAISKYGSLGYESTSALFKACECKYTTYRMQTYSAQDDIPELAIATAVAMAHARSWVQSVPNYEVYVLSRNSSWLQQSEWRHCSDRERIIRRHFDLVNQNRMITKEQVTCKIQELFPDAIIRTP